MADAFNQSLVYKTNPDPWHQLLILSQFMINDAYWNMWAISDASSPIHTIAMKDRAGDTLTAKLEAPEVLVNVLNLSPQLWYILKFASGTMDLYTTDDPNNPDQKHFDHTGWKLVFPVSIAAKEINPSDPNYQSYLNEMGNPSGVFSLTRLFIDTSSAAIYDKSLSSFGTTDWSKETDTVRGSFATLVDGWFNRMTAQGKTLLGISLQTKDPSTVNPHAPSFPPTSINYGSYPWLDPAVPTPAPANGLDQNALAYLIQTGNNAAPSPAVLDHSGVFTDGSTQTPGTITINRSQFFGQWFLPLLKLLNQASEIQCTKPVAEAYGNGSVKVGPRFTMSYNPSHTDPNDAYFDFQTQGDGSYAWNGSQMTSHKDDNAGGSGWNKIHVDEDSQAWSTVKFTAGGQTITVQGGNSFNFRCKQTGFASGPFKTAATFSIKLAWHIYIAIGVVSDGGLQVSRLPDSPGVSAITVTGTSSNDGIDWETPWDSYEDEIRRGMETYFDSKLAQVENVLVDGLANQNKLFLPGSGSFLIQAAQINARGDLLATLHYNGAPPPGGKREVPGYLKELPKRKGHKPVAPLPPSGGWAIAFPPAKIFPKDPLNKELYEKGREHWLQQEQAKRDAIVKKFLK